MIIRKIIAHLRWFIIYIPAGIFAFLTAPIIYPIAQLIEFVLPKHNPLWCYMDDEIEDLENNHDWRIYKKDSPTWIKYYSWHAFRNTMWNLKMVVKPKKGRENCVWNKEKIIELKQDNLTNKGVKLDLNELCFYRAQLKWITKDGEEGWHVFSGEKVSYDYSIFGTVEYWYEVDGTLYYRYSTVRDITIFGVTFLFSFAMGATEKRYLLNIKLNVKNKVM